MQALRSVTLSLSALALCAAACSSQKAAVQQDQPPKVAEQAPAPQPAPVASASDAGAEGAARLTDALRDLQNVSVFFKLDDDALSDEAKEKLATVGQLLAKYPHLRVRIEGNCDERGTSAYNLALGQRRAEASRHYLSTMGAREDQMQAISYGNQHPKAQGHDEAAWQLNRRDDLVAIDTHQ